MNKIAGVIVTYNRRDELAKNIDMLLKQEKKLDCIYVINNNSTDDTQDYLDKNYKSDVITINLPENIGGAGGFSYGTKVAAEAGYDYIVLMDDDGRPYDEKTILELYNFAEKIDNKKIMINSLVMVDGMKLSFGLSDTIDNVDAALKNSKDGGYISDLINPFNGTLISKALINEIGIPNASFFIKGDEVDYKIRAQKANAFIATIVNSLYFHPTFNKGMVKRLFLKFKNDLEAPWKEYYRARNYTYMHGKKFKKRIRIRLIKSILFHDKEYKSRNKMIKNGYKDGLRKKMGKVVEPGQKIYNKR